MSDQERDDALKRQAFEAYLERTHAGNLDPADDPLPYDFDRFSSRAWRAMGDVLVRNELRELTNILNRWHALLAKWHAWNDVLTGHSDAEAWPLRWHFFESDAHVCLTLPSAIRNALTFVATNGAHLARMSIDCEYQDVLEGDPTQPGKQPKPLSRGQREKRLSNLLKPWQAGPAMLDVLCSLDDEAYRKSTYDYRNEHSHAIGPSLGIGETRFMTRRVEQATEMIHERDGAARFELVPGKMAVSYHIGGRPPLDMEASRLANLAQYYRARECFTRYVDILDTALQSMPVRSTRSDGS